MLKGITDWLREQILKIWEAFAGFMEDLFLIWVEHTLDMVIFVFGLVPAPDFLSQHTLGSLLGQAGPTVGWLVMTFRIGEGLALISSAMAFYLVRRILTVGIW